MKIKIVAFLAALMWSPPLCAQQVLTPEVRSGEVLIIQTQPDSTLEVFGKSYRSNKNGILFVGVDLLTLPGTYRVGETEFEVIGVETGVRKRKPGRIGPKRKKELQALSQAYAMAKTLEWYPQDAFKAPLEELFITSNFMIGHGGVDLRAQKPVPVYAVNSGKVLMVARRFSLEGNMVIVDHGSGVLSYYMHLSSFSVKEGQTVKANQPLGKTGRTGAVSGPHLHFAVKVNGTNVSPLSFIETINRIF